MAQTDERRKQYKNIAAEVTNTLYGQINSAAKKAGMTRSEFIRFSLLKAIHAQESN